LESVVSLIAEGLLYGTNCNSGNQLVNILEIVLLWYIHCI